MYTRLMLFSLVSLSEPVWNRGVPLTGRSATSPHLAFHMAAQSLDYCKYVMDKIDIILLMSVNPGFGGQKFIPATLAKAKEARKMIDESVRPLSPHPPLSLPRGQALSHALLHKGVRAGGGMASVAEECMS